MESSRSVRRGAGRDRPRARVRRRSVRLQLELVERLGQSARHRRVGLDRRHHRGIGHTEGRRHAAPTASPPRATAGTRPRTGGPPTAPRSAWPSTTRWPPTTRTRSPSPTWPSRSRPTPTSRSGPSRCARASPSRTARPLDASVLKTIFEAHQASALTAPAVADLDTVQVTGPLTAVFKMKAAVGHVPVVAHRPARHGAQPETLADERRHRAADRHRPVQDDAVADRRLGHHRQEPDLLAQGRERRPAALPRRRELQGHHRDPVEDQRADRRRHRHGRPPRCPKA